VARAFVAFGSNLGDAEEEGVEVTAVSSLEETEPVGYLEQPQFLNGAVELRTELPPRALLDLLLALEARFGRERAGVPAGGPRTLDLDLLLYENESIDEPGLRIPHPRLHERAFVLRPLAELDPALEVPGKGPIQTLLAGLH
jgi:2-amino-4-hydroxy-6-hydroxymethyldihydropteridine diphosphokinase